MTNHDPVCPYEMWTSDECHCHSIAIARADEREKRDVHWERVLYDSQARHEEKVASATKFARADEREKIAQAIEADRDALTRRINDTSDPYWSAEQANEWAIERVALNRAAQIARNGGRND